jgi:uncharacterized repeat protein (TIGR03843 family)
VADPEAGLSSAPADAGGPASTAGAAATLEALRDGDLEVVGRLPGSTNQALVVLVRHPARPEPFPAVYKAARGERPLFDFPFGTLVRREVAAFALSEHLGWSIVPPTVLRDGPFGEGSVQEWIFLDESVDQVALVNDDDPRLRRMAVFDALANNTDRKIGHILPAPEGRLFGVDHGVTFSPDPKLRTVLWGWAGEPLAEDEIEGVRRVSAGLRRGGELAAALAPLLSPDEVLATKRRAASLLRTRRFPLPRPDWPAIPWPPY